MKEKAINFERLDALFHMAVEMPESERRLFVEKHCGDERALCDELERMLAADREPSILDRPPRPPDLTGISSPIDDDGTGTLRGQVIGDRIRLERVLGRGGMGHVYAGYDEKLRREVAVKVLHRGAAVEPDARSRARLLREARLLCQLRHPSICQVHDHVEGGQHDFLVLERIDGLTLRQRIQEGVTRSAALSYAEQIAEALVAAHAEGIVHRDLKPENVMVARSGDDERIKVLDFGVAQMMEVELGGPQDVAGPVLEPRRPAVDGTVSDGALGTPRYMSPEQARGEKATAASDMFSFGLLLQELLTGRPAYSWDLRHLQLLKKVLSVETAPRSGLGNELEGLLNRLMSPTPVARPTAADAVEYLRRIRAAPRRRLFRFLTAAVVSVLAVLVVTLGGLASRLNRALEKTDQLARIALARQLSAQAAVHLEDHLDLGLLLSLEAFRTADILETRSGLLAGVEASPRLRRFLRNGSAQKWSVAWHPEGRLLASGEHSGKVFLWDTHRGEIVASYQAHEGRRSEVWNLAWSPDGRRLGSAGGDHRLAVFGIDVAEAADGDLRVTAARQMVLTPGDRDLWEIAWSDDGQRFFSVAWTGTVGVWDAVDGERVATLTLPEKLHAQSLSPRGDWLALAAESGTTYLWDLVRETFAEPLPAHSLAVWDLAWSRDGRLLASCSEDGTVDVWDVGRRRRVASLNVPAGSPTRIAWGPDATRLAVGTQLGTAHIWKIDSHPPQLEALHGHNGWVNDLAWHGQKLASASPDGTVAFWDVREFLPQLPMRGHRHSVMGLALRPQKDVLASGGVDAAIRLWDTATGEAIGQMPANGTVTTLSWSRDGRRLVTSGESNVAQVWDLDRRQRVRDLAGHENSTAAAWSPCDERIVTASYDQTLAMWEMPSGRMLERFTLGERLYEPMWSPTCDLISVGDGAGRVHVRTDAGEVSRVFEGHRAAVVATAWSPSGVWLASGDLAGEIRLWNVRTGEGRTLPGGHTGKVRGLDWSADDRLASVSDDKTAIVWDVAKGEPLARLVGHGQRVRAVRWAPGGRLFTAGDDSTIQVHDLSGGPAEWRERACRRAGRNLTPNEWRRYISSDEPYRRSCPEFPAG